MNNENLVSMANRIGQFFSAYPDVSEGQREVANHLRKFWAPRMRRSLLTFIDHEKETGLDPFVLGAVEKFRVDLTPTEAEHTEPSP